MGNALVACGCATVEGRSYCEEHLWVVYQKGSNLRTRHKDRRIADTVWNIQDAFNEAIEQLESEGYNLSDERWDVKELELD
jgi:hypothetical protein